MKRVIASVAVFVALIAGPVFAQCNWVGVTETCGSVGIGTASPVSLLHLAGNSGVEAVTFNTPGPLQKFRFQTVPGVVNWGAMTLNANYNSGWFLDDTTTNGWFFKLDTRGGNGASDNNGLWLFRVPSNTNHVDEAKVFGVTAGRVYLSGNVGINTETPAYALDVNGSIRATSVIGATYQDLAEWVPSSEAMPAGTVVVINAEKTNEVKPSARSYDTSVAGVVSAQPGLLLGEPAKTKSMIATTGRVKVRVDASARAVHVGDLLVTSDKPGTAMVSEPIEIGGVKIHRPGTLIGKALEPLSGGQGEVLVLLSLQ